MSYCRFSCEDFACDLYCYASADGWVTHVAANRPVGDVPKVPADWHSVPVDELCAAMNRQVDFLKACARMPLGLPHDGATFVDPTPSAFLSRLLHLREVGYRFPDHVIEDAREEAVAEPPEPPEVGGGEPPTSGGR